MPVIEREATLPHSAEQMFCLVDAIDKYPEFVPACSEATILERSEDQVRASLTFARGGISKSFTTLNLRVPHRLMELRLIDGPFKMLEGIWSFTDLDSGSSRVRLDMEFEFDSKILALMFGPVFESVANKLVDTFVKRANVVYAKKIDK